MRTTFIYMVPVIKFQLQTLASMLKSRQYILGLNKFFVIIKIANFGFSP